MMGNPNQNQQPINMTNTQPPAAPVTSPYSMNQDTLSGGVRIVRGSGINRTTPTNRRFVRVQPYKSPTWFKANRDKFEFTPEGLVRATPTDKTAVNVDRALSKIPWYQPKFEQDGSALFDPGEADKDWHTESKVENGVTYNRVVFHPRQQEVSLQSALEKEQPQPGEQQFGLAPGDPNTTLRGGLAQFMGNPVVKVAETGLGGTLPGAIVGSAIFPGVGTLIGAGVGTGLSLLAGQEQFDENNLAARGLAGLGGAAIGQALIPIPVLGAVIGGVAGLIAGPKILDAGRQLLEQGIGTGEQIIGAAVDPTKYGTLNEATSNLKATWEAAANTYETSTLDVRALTPDGWGKYDLFNSEDKVFVDWDLPATTGGLSALVEARRRIAAGEDERLVNAEVAARFGAPGQLRELGSGFVLDPLNYAGEIQKAGLKGFARATGDELLSKAAKEAGHGGFVDAMQRYKQLLTNEKMFKDGFGQAQEMNRLQRAVIGEDLIRLASEGKYQEPKWWEVWKLTPDSQAKDRVVQADNYIQAYLSSIPVDENYGDKALAVLKNLKDGPQYGPIEPGMDEVIKASQTIEGRVVKRHLDLSSAEDTVKAWGDTADLRNELIQIADGAGLKPGEIVRRISELTDQGDDGLARLANELKAKPGFPTEAFGNDAVTQLKTLGKVFGDGAVPMTPEHLKAAIISGQIEASAKWAVNTFGIKPPPFMDRVAAAVKGVQSTVLLGLNPGYVVNNIINGEVTMAARGVWGLRGIVEARDTLARAGIEPARLASGGTIGDLDVAFNPGELLGKAQAAGFQTISEAQKYEGALADIQRAGRKLSEHLPATAMAPKVEKAQSLRAFYEGWKQFMGQQWKRGRGMPKMDSALEAAIARVDAGLVDRLYAAAEAGLNPQEIATKVFAQRVPVAVQGHIDDAAQRLGMQADDVARVLSTDGIDELLNEGLDRAGDNVGRVRKVFDEARSQAEAARVQAHAEEVQTHAAYAVEAAKAGDAGEMLNLMDDVEMRLYETYQSHMNALEEEWQRINSSGVKNSQLKQALIAAQRDRSGKQWQGFFDYEDAVTKGLADGLEQGGLKLDQNFNTAARSKRMQIDKFNTDKNAMLEAFFKLPDEERTPDAWAATTGAINDVYANLTRDLSDITAKVDDYMAAEFARRYNTATGEAFTAWRDAVRTYKQQDMAEVLAFRQQVSQVRSAPLKDKMWREFNDARLKRLHEIEQQSIGLRRKVAEVMNGVTPTQPPPSATGEGRVSIDLARVMERQTWAESAIGNEPPSRPSPVVEQMTTGEGVAAPITIGEAVISEPEAAAIADVVQREMAVQAAAGDLASVGENYQARLRFRDGMVVPAEWLDEKGQLRIPASAEVSPMSPSVMMPQSARDYLELQVREFVRNNGQQNAMTDAVMALVDARAEVWAQQTGLKAEDYIPRHFALGDPGDVTFIGEMNRAGGETLAQRTARSRIQDAGRAERAGQIDMFAGQPEVAPLFSGVPSTVADSAFVPTEAAQQGTLFDMRPEFGGATGFPPEARGNDVAAGPLFYQAVQPVAQAVTPQWKYEDYSTWSRQIAKDYTRAQIEKELGIAASKREGLAASHLRAIDATGSMSGNSQRRAQSRNSMTGNYERWNAYKNALELYDVYPQHTKEGLKGLLQAGKTTKGSVQFLEDGRAVLRALTAPDVSTAAHEVGHVFLRDLMDVANDAAAPGRMQAAADVGTAQSWMAAEAINLSTAAEAGTLTPAQRSAFGFAEGSNWIDAIDDAGNMTTSGQEIWARGFERFLADGTAPTEGLRRVFEQFKQWLGKIYSKVRGRNEIDVNMSPDMRQVYERLFAETAPTQALPRLTGEGAIQPVENPQLIARHELPGQLPNAMEDWARQAMNDLNAGTPGQRIFGDEGQGVIASQSSTYPEWYKAMSARYGSNKQQVVNALDKIIRDHGTDTGLTVERLKELGLKELANGFEVVGARIPADPEARALLGLEVTPEMEQQWADMSAQLKPPPQPSPAGAGEGAGARSSAATFYQSGPGEVVVETPQGPVTVTGIDDKTITMNGQAVPIIADGNAPLPPGVLADMGARPMPIAQALDESYSNTLRPILNQLQQSIEDGLPTVRGNVGALPDDLQAGVRAWVDQVNQKMASTKLQATKWGEYKRDSALLNYSRRYKYNTYLGMVSPYEFFTTQSMVKWALHSIDKPQVAANYYRLSKFFSTQVTKAGFPSRLAGQMRIPVPFLPEWAGGGVFVDPMKVGLPLQNWAAPWEQEQQREQRLSYRITSTLDQWVDDGQISEADAAAAKQQGAGELWQRAADDAVAKDPSLGSDALDTAMAVMPPSLPLQYAMNRLRGKEGEITQLPITRFTKAVATMLGADAVVGNLDKSVRRAMDLPVLDDWTAYRVDTELANLAAEGVITSDQAREAMISRSGAAYSLAEHREAQESEYSTIGSGVFGTAVKVCPEGEQNLRVMQQLYKAARDAQNNGDTDALNKFFDQNPAYEARLALYKNPDERLRQFTTSKIWERWQDMPSAYQQDLQQGFGPEFQQAFLNKGTRSIEDIPIETLTRWARTMGQMIPGRPDTKPVPIAWSDPATAQQVEVYYNQREDLFDWPTVRKLQTQYYEIPYEDAVTVQVGVYKSGAKRGQPKYSSIRKRDTFIDQHPDYKAYLDWRKDFLKQYPNVQGYLDEQSLMINEETPTLTPPPSLSLAGMTSAQRLAQAQMLLGRQLPADVMTALAGGGQ